MGVCGIAVRFVPSWIFIILLLKCELRKAEDYNQVNRDGSFQFGYDTPDSFHNAQGNRNNVVQGQFGGRNPKTGEIDTVSYTAGKRGFRPRGKNIVRKYDFSQSGPRPLGSVDDPYFDPNEDPSYNFAFRTRTYNRQEAANSVGDVAGKYSYLDDVGERHNVEFIAGKDTGFHVKTPFPDSNPRASGPLYFHGRGRPYPRGRTSIQRGLDGSYRFISAGPDQRRTEAADASGNVRGSYTYLDDKGVQHSVHYIAGPGIGYRVLKNVKEPHLPTFFPYGRSGIIPPDFYDYPEEDVFDTAATGHPKPNKGSSRPNKPDIGGSQGTGTGGFDDSFDTDGTTPSVTFPSFSSTPRPLKPSGKPRRPTYDDFADDDDTGDLFSDTSSSPAKPRPRPPTTHHLPGGSSEGGDGGFTGGGGNEDAYDDGSYKPFGEGGHQGAGGGKKPRPTISPGGDGFTTYRGNRPKPSYSNVDDNDINNFDLFDRPQSGGGGGGRGGDRGGSGAGGGRGGGSSGGDYDGGTGRRPGDGAPQDGGGFSDIGISGGRGTIVTNVGEKPFSVPPGVSVRAHVQAIDLLPLGPRSPSPSDQLKAETKNENDDTINVTDHYKASASEVDVVTTKFSTQKPFDKEDEVTTVYPSTIPTESTTYADATTTQMEIETKETRIIDDEASLFK